MKQALALAFFNRSSSCACCRLAARSSTVVAGSNAAPNAAATGVLEAFYHW